MADDSSKAVANASIQTVSFCDLLILQREDFDAVLVIHKRRRNSLLNEIAHPTHDRHRHSCRQSRWTRAFRKTRETVGDNSSPEMGRGSMAESSLPSEPGHAPPKPRRASFRNNAKDDALKKFHEILDDGHMKPAEKEDRKERWAKLGQTIKSHGAHGGQLASILAGRRRSSDRAAPLSPDERRLIDQRRRSSERRGGISPDNSFTKAQRQARNLSPEHTRPAGASHEMRRPPAAMPAAAAESAQVLQRDLESGLGGRDASPGPALPPAYLDGASAATAPGSPPRRRPPPPPGAAPGEGDESFSAGSASGPPGRCVV